MKREVSSERLYESFLQVNQVALTVPAHETVFRGMCEALKNVMPYERAGLALYDPDREDLKIIDLYGPFENSIFRVGQLLSRDGTQSAWAFENKTPLFRSDLQKQCRFPADRDILQEGYRSLCSVPLLVGESSIGVVTVAATRRNQLSMHHARMLQEMSNQIALAIHCKSLTCPSHTQTKLVCPRCIGAAGGQATVTKHREHLSTWGKQGGRGRKRKRSDLNSLANPGSSE